MARKSTGKRVRFEVFKRDAFRCRYCGATAIQTLLHVDHVVPVSEGGTDDHENLVTACADCNLGKAAVPLDEIRIRTSGLSAEAAREHAEQVREYLAAQRELADFNRAAAEEMAAYWESIVGPMTQGMFDRLPALLREWPYETLVYAMQATASKFGSTGQPFVARQAVQQAKYFHGVLRRIRADGVR